MYIINARGEYRLLAQPQRVAFREEGRRLVTENDDPVAIRGMLDVARAKGWGRVNLAGSDTFRRIAWLEAGVRGMQTSGYAPTVEDRQRLEEWLAERAPEEAGPGRRSRAGGVQPAEGRGKRDSSAASPVEPDGIDEGRSDANRARQADRDAVVMAVAQEVLRRRDISGQTRLRILGAISRRLNEFRERGKDVSVRTHDVGVHGRAVPRRDAVVPRDGTGPELAPSPSGRLHTDRER
jgi:hypothetical protein